MARWGRLLCGRHVAGAVMLACLGLAACAERVDAGPADTQRLLWCRAAVQAHLFRLPPGDASRGELTQLFRSLNQRSQEALRADGHDDRDMQSLITQSVEAAHVRAGPADVSACRRQFGLSGERPR